MDVGDTNGSDSREVLPGGWEWCSVSLPYRAGGATFVEIDLEVAHMTTSSIRLSSSAGVEFPSDAMRELGTDVAVIYSCPVDGVQPKVTLSRDGLRYVPSHFPHHHLDVSGNFQSYLKAQLRSKSRSTLQRKVKKLTKLSGGQLDIREYRTSEELRTWHQLAREVSKKTYQERLLKNGLPETPEYLESVCADGDRGSFRGYLLFYEDVAIAYLACPIHDGGIMVYDYVGHDPDRNGLSPGTVLFYSVLEGAFADESIQVFDFTAGDGDHKKRYATHTTNCAEVWFFKPTPKYIAMVAAHAALTKTDALALGALERFEVKDQVKRFVRNFRSGS